MRESVQQILEEKYDYENSSLDFSCAKVEVTMRSGDIFEGSFHIFSSDAGFTRGYVSSTDMRMECVTKEFTGDGEEILYCFHGEHMQEGDVVKGNFCVVSNQGEYYLPFVVTAKYDTLPSSVGEIKNLFHFANLAKSNWHEAVKLFYSPDFVKLFERKDRQYYDCYRGLSTRRGNEQNVEEFLIRINKKQRTQYLVREEEIVKELEDIDSDVVECELNITKNGWGYTMLHVACEGEFLFTEKVTLREDDFLGNRVVLPVFIDTQNCRKGKNFGKVRLYNSHDSIEIPVLIRLGADGRRATAGQRKQDVFQMMEYYQDFRMKRINSDKWMKSTGEVVERMLARDEDDVAARLFKAQLLISEERYNEAGWTLDHAADLMEAAGTENSLYAYYLYLTTLIERTEEYVNEITEQVQRLYAKERTNWRIAWLLLYLSEEYSKTPAARWDFLEKQFKQGCSSPVLYIEGLQLLNGNPTLLRKLDETVLPVLYYGARREVLRSELQEQILYLTGYEKDYSQMLLRLLMRLYEINASEHILQEICTMLVRGNRVGPAWFSWYDAGVKAQLRITNLYEYYMLSIDMEQVQKLPKIVLMYFAYQNNLDLQHMTFLYWYVEQHKLELGEIYDSYKPRMEHFIIDQIQKESIGRHLAFLYQRLLTPAMIDRQTAGALAKLQFAHRICVQDMNLKRVVVYQQGNLREYSVPMQNGTAWVPLYGNDSTILFEDEYGNRFAKTVDYTLEKLMIPGKYLRIVAAMVQDNTNLDIYLEENEHAGEEIPVEAADRMLRLAFNEDAEEYIRRRVCLRLLKHYYDVDNVKALDELLDMLPLELFSQDERAEALQYVVLRDKMDEAWDRIREYGPYYVEQKALLRLLDERIGRLEEEDPELTDVVLYAFRQGKYDSRMIQYLERYADCPTKELRDIWKAARSYELEAVRLSERILLQMLFSGAFVGEKTAIFTYYAENGGDASVVEAFLARCAYDYFVKERLTDDVIFREISRIARQKDVLKVCKLALLKYYAENIEEITSEMGPVIEAFLHEFLAEKIHLNFFRNYVGKSVIREPMLMELMDKTIVEYHAGPGVKTEIHYVVMYEDGQSSEYRTEPMREVYGGVCFKEFVLFFGESLQYYITEGKDQDAQLTESGNLQKSDIHGKNSDWRYEMINDILVSRMLEDFDTLDGLMDEYHRREYLGENLFTLQ